MKLFISWSGDRSHEMAKTFKEYLPKILSDLLEDDIFLSSSDIKIGDIWFEQIRKDLEESDAALVILTAENIDSPWLLFEAGAVSNKKNNLIFSYIIDDLKIESTSPLYHYQATKNPSEDNTKDLILSMYDGKEINEIIANYNKYWPNIESTLNKIKNVVNVSDTIKIESSEIRQQALKLVESNKNTPFSHAFCGWYSSLIEEVITPARQHSFTASPRFYHYCLEGLHKSGITDIKTIADLSKPVENWSDNEIDLWSGVSERIFVIDWKDMFSTEYLPQIMRMIKKSVEQSLSKGGRIYLITNKGMLDIKMPKLVDNKETIGYHLLFLEPTLVGGYIKDSNGQFLYLEATKKESKLTGKVKKFYNEVKGNSIEITENDKIGSDYNELLVRKKWLDKNSFGEWKEEWNDQTYTENYCNNYDVNIQLWTPAYEKLLERCSVIIQEEIVKIFREHNNSLSILEIGYGTGALTSKILNGIRDINRPEHIYREKLHNHCIPVSKIYGTDSSTCMKKILNNILSQTKYRFEIDIRDDEFNIDWTLGEKVDIVFGSLILHHIFKGKKQSKIQEVFSHIGKNILKDKSASMIFLCTLFSDIDSEKDEQMKYWTEHMKTMGHDEDVISNYMNNNKNMTSPPSFEQLLEASKYCGFSIKKHSVYERSPFNILTMTRNLF